MVEVTILKTIMQFFVFSRIILLLEDGNLQWICQYTLLPLFQQNIDLEDFLVIDDDKNYQILGVSKPVGNVKQIKLLEPGKCCFSYHKVVF